ncbi:DUF4382 domain-containing protein [bacterium]|nr:DUF4382 domain-containing protein [bacterium]
MKKSKLKLNPKFLIALFAISVIFIGCKDNDDPNPNNDGDTYSARFEATDAPIDNAEVDAVFVTVAEVWVDDQQMEGFQKTTLELSALTNGNTELLGEFESESSTMSEVTLVLDYDFDAEGNAPGSYVLLEGGTKDQISSSSNEIKLTNNAMLEANSTKTFVIDFDLRKIITETGSDFELVTNAELETHIRTVEASATSTVEGNIEGMSSTDSAKTVVYLYRKGEFDASTELAGEGQSDVQFANAVNSNVASDNGDFRLSFIEEGEYELYVFNYSDEDNDGRFEVDAMAQLQLGTNLDFSDVSVSSDSDVNLDLEVGALLPL